MTADRLEDLAVGELGVDLLRQDNLVLLTVCEDGVGRAELSDVLRQFASAEPASLFELLSALQPISDLFQHLVYTVAVFKDQDLIQGLRRLLRLNFVKAFQH